MSKGAGEALRGAVNSNLARHTGASPAEIAAADAVTDRGRREIETGQFQRFGNVPVAAPPTMQQPEANMNTTTNTGGVKLKKSGGLRNVLRKSKENV